MIPGAREILPRISGEKSGNDLPARRGGSWTGSRGLDNSPVFSVVCGGRPRTTMTSTMSTP
jgi:hypothetical protein